MKLTLNKIFNFNKYKNLYPYSVFKTYFLKEKISVSDFFVFRLDDYETIFLAENTLSLVLAEKIKCKHSLHFYSEEGNLINTHSIETEDFFTEIKFSKLMTNGFEVGLFIHQIDYDQNIKHQYNDIFDSVSFNHRGYSGYRKLGKTAYSFVHGNFGSIYIDNNGKLETFARQRKNFSYTPQMEIIPNTTYELFFVNPTKRNLQISLLLSGKNLKIEFFRKIDIKPFGYKCINLKSNDLEGASNFSWVTKLPVGRALIFEHFQKGFDVFHS